MSSSICMLIMLTPVVNLINHVAPQNLDENKPYINDHLQINVPNRANVHVHAVIVRERICHK